MNKYIIEIEEEPFVRRSALYGEDALYRAKGFNALVFDKNGLDKLKPLDKMLEEVYQYGLNEGKAHNENRCVECRYNDGTTEHSPCDYCCNTYSNQWVARQKNDNKIKLVKKDDAISRQAAINVFYESWGTSLTRTVDAIKHLPSVQLGNDKNVVTKISREPLELARAIDGLTEWQKHVQTDSSIDRNITVAIEALKAQLGTRR